MHLTTQEIAAILQRIAELLKNKEDVIHIPQDEYWSILADIVPASDEQPPSTGIGSLADDWKELQRVFQRPYGVSELDLRRLGYVLLAIGDTLANNARTVSTPYDFIVSIELVLLQEVSSFIFQRLGLTAAGEIKIQEDEYWAIKLEKLFSFEDGLSEPECEKRSIAEDMARLQELLVGRQAIPDDVSLFGMVLTAIGEYPLQNVR